LAHIQQHLQVHVQIALSANEAIQPQVFGEQKHNRALIAPPDSHRQTKGRPSAPTAPLGNPRVGVHSSSVMLALLEKPNPQKGQPGALIAPPESSALAVQTIAHSVKVERFR
jgi:hypothetical protein